MGLLQEYLGKHSQGNFASDARYRLMVCKYAASLYPEVLADGVNWLRDYPQNPQEGEVQALIVAVKLGDDFLTARQFTEALACYRAVRSREHFGPALKAIHSIQDMMATLFRKMPYEQFAGAHIGGEDVYAARPNWLSQDAPEETTHA